MYRRLSTRCSAEPLEVWRELSQKIVLNFVGDPEHQHSGQVDPLGLNTCPSRTNQRPIFFDPAENEVGQPDFAYEVTMPPRIGAGTLGVPPNLCLVKPAAKNNRINKSEDQADDEHRTHWSVWSPCTIEAPF